MIPWILGLAQTVNTSNRDTALLRFLDLTPATVAQIRKVSVTLVATELTVDILDILHVSQYAWHAAKMFHFQRKQQESFARERLKCILSSDVNSVITGLRRMATMKKLKGKAATEIQTACGYFTKNASRMKYNEYLQAGYPVATGVIEGACRDLVKDRMERSGMRWSIEGAQAMLHPPNTGLTPESKRKHGLY